MSRPRAPFQWKSPPMPRCLIWSSLRPADAVDPTTVWSFGLLNS